MKKISLFLPSFLIISLCLSYHSRAQISNYNFRQYQGNYQSLNLSAAFHLNSNTANFADDTMHFGSYLQTNFRGLPIGFDFVFDGDTQNVFGISSAGHMVLGKNNVSMYPSWASALPLSGNGVYKIISPLGGIYTFGAIKVNYKTSGIAPNRVLTVEWADLLYQYDYNNPIDRDRINFQAKLFESTNKIQFVYGPMNWCNLNSNVSYVVGLKGNSNADFNSRILLSDWQKTIPAAYATGNCRLGKKMYPISGTVFEFSPPPVSCDSALFPGFAFARTYSICGNEKVELTLDSVKMSASVNWQWQHSTDSLTWSDIPGATQKNYSGQQSSTSYYRCKIICGATSFFTNALKVFQLKNLQCYCKNVGSSYANAINIGSVSISVISYGSAIPQVNNNSNFKRYSDHTFLAPASLARGGNIAITVKPIYKDAYEKTGAYAYIDFNKDGDFLDGNEMFYLGKSKSGTSGFELKHFIQVPATADTGVTLLRVSLYGVNNTIPPISACANPYDGETEDYLVRILPAPVCSSLPSHITAFSLSPILCLTDTLVINLSQNITAAYSYQWYSSPDTLNWASIPGATKNNFSAIFSQAAFYRCKLKCANDSIYSSWVHITAKPAVNCFCKSQSNWYTASKITKMEFDTFSNISGFGGALYSNYFDLDTIRVVKHGRYSFALEVQSPSGDYGYPRVFIDYNQNGNYDVGESFSLGQPSYAFGYLRYEAIIEIPSGIPNGLCLLRLMDESQNSGPQFCNYGDMDEVEDYLLEIYDADPCISPINAGVALSKDSAICESGMAQITLSGINYSPNYSYRWQFSNDSMNWNSVLGDTLFSMHHEQDSTTFYRCRISCSGDTAFSVPVKIAKKEGYACCKCQTVYGLHNDIGNVTFAGLSYGQFDSLDLKVNSSNTNLGNAYTDFTDSLAPFVVEQNGHYPLSITEIYSDAVYPFSQFNQATIYIDFDQNQRYDTNEVFKSSVLDGWSIFTGTALIHIPVNAVLGITQMRIILSYSSPNFIFPPCNPAFFSYEIEDYLVTIVASQPCMQPIAGFVVTPKNALCLNEIINLTLNGNTNFGGQTYQWQRSNDNVSWTSISNANTNRYYEGCQATAFFRCIVTCGVYADTSVSKQVQLKPFYQCNCINTNNSPPYYFDEMDIGKVSFGTFNNGNPMPGTNNPGAIHQYSDFTNLPPAVFNKGNVYPLSVTQINLGNFYRCQVLAIIDLNHDKNFTMDEVFDMGMTSDSSFAGRTVSKNIKIPYYAHSGTTLLRIFLVEKEHFDNTPLYDCNHFYNEMEDYAIDIAPDNYCQQFNPGVTLLTIGKACKHEAFYAYLTGNTLLDGPVYTWQTSVDSINWSPYALSDNPYLLTDAYAPIYYRCKISCDTLNSYSIPVRLQMEDTAYCIPYLASGWWYCNQVLGGSDCDTNNRISNVAIDWTSLNNSDTTCCDIGYDKHYYYHAYGNHTANLQRGKTYTIRATTTKNDAVSAWIDYNHNSLFDASEWIHICDTSVAGIANAQVFTVPSTALMGKATLRVRSRYHDNPNAANDGCIRFFSGETEDYIITIDTITAVIELSGKADFSIYPNPAKNTIRITSEEEIHELTILEITGKKVMEIKPNKETNSIDVSKIAGGIYFIQCKFKDNAVGYKKIVIHP